MTTQELQEIIDGFRAMLEDFLTRIGMYGPGQRIADERLLKQFSDWLAVQDVTEDLFHPLVARVNAFIQEYMVEGHSAIRRIVGEKILLYRLMDPARGEYRKFDTIPLAADIVRNHGSLKDLIHAMCAPDDPAAAKPLEVMIANDVIAMDLPRDYLQTILDDARSRPRKGLEADVHFYRGDGVPPLAVAVTNSQITVVTELHGQTMIQATRAASRSD